MTRVKIKGSGTKPVSSPEQEPDFYALPPVLSRSAMEVKQERERLQCRQSSSASGKGNEHSDVITAPKPEDMSGVSAEELIVYPTNTCYQTVPTPVSMASSQDPFSMLRWENQIKQPAIAQSQVEGIIAPKTIWVYQISIAVDNQSSL
jgi:hypothetical protein